MTRRPRTPRKRGRIEAFNHATSEYMGGGSLVAGRTGKYALHQVGATEDGTPIYMAKPVIVVVVRMDNGPTLPIHQVYYRVAKSPWWHKQNRVAQRKLDVVHDAWVAEEKLNADVGGFFR